MLNLELTIDEAQLVLVVMGCSVQAPYTHTAITAVQTKIREQAQKQITESQKKEQENVEAETLDTGGDKEAGSTEEGGPTEGADDTREAA